MLELLLSMTTHAILVFDEAGKVLLVNPAAVNMFGYSEVEFKKRRLSSLLPKQSVKNHAQLLKSFISGVESLRKMGEYREVAARRKNGEEFPVDASIGKAELNGQNVLVASLRDISAEKRAEESNRSLALLPKENPNPVMRIASSGKILYANASAIKFLTYIGIPNADLAHAAWHVYLKEALENGNQTTKIIQHSERFYSCVFAPVREMSYVNLYTLDVTEREV